MADVSFVPIDHRPSTIDHRPSTIDHRPSTIDHRPWSAVLSARRIETYERRVAICGGRAGYGPPSLPRHAGRGGGAAGGGVRPRARADPAGAVGISGSPRDAE